MIIKALVVAGGYTWHQKKGENNPRLKAAGIVRYYTLLLLLLSKKRLEKCNLCVCDRDNVDKLAVWEKHHFQTKEY